MPVPNLYARAAKVLGGAEQLALHLKVTPSHLALWMAGTEPTPAHMFLKAVDLISEQEDPARPAPNTSPPNGPSRPAN